MHTKENGFQKLYNPDANENNTLKIFQKDTEFFENDTETFKEYYATETGSSLSAFKNIVVNVDGASKTIAFDENSTAGDAKSLRLAIGAALRKEGYATKNNRDAINDYYDEGSDETDIRIISSLKLESLTTDGDVTVSFTELDDKFGLHKYTLSLPGDTTSVTLSVQEPDGTEHESYAIAIDGSIESAADVDGELQTNLATAYEAEVEKDSDNNFDVDLYIYAPYRLYKDGTAVERVRSEEVFGDAAVVPQPS